MVTKGLDRRAEGKPGVAAGPAIFAGRNPADAADIDLASVPHDGAEVDADMAGQSGLDRFLRRVNQHAQVGMGPFDMAP
jgi:hypothetical protein